MRCNKKVCGFVVGAGATVACAVAAARTKKGAHADRSSKWDKMRKGMDEMPEDFPPRVMYDNVASTRENVDRILEILERGASEDAEPTTEARVDAPLLP